MNAPHQHPPPRHGAVRQGGIVLAVVLVLLAVLTILAVAGIGTAVLELRMADNAQQRVRAFAAAEFAIEQAVAAAEFDTALTPADPGRPACGEACTTPATGDPFNYAVYYESSAGGTPAPDGGHSLAAGLEAHHFVVESTGASGAGARAELVQGFYVVGPADD
jgi:Tfp pilus assembly protein PilX